VRCIFHSACVSPDITNGNETLCTLQYANRARTIQNKAQKNVEEASTEDIVGCGESVLHGTESERELDALRAQVAALKLQLDEAIAAAKEAESRGSARVEGADDSVKATTAKTQKSSKSRRRRRIAPLEFDSSPAVPRTTCSGASCYSESAGIVEKSSRQLREEGFAHFKISTSTAQPPLEDPRPRVPDIPLPISPVVSSSSSPSSTEDTAPRDEEAASASLSRQTRLPARKSSGANENEHLSRRDRVMIDQGTQYESPLVQQERKTPIDFVLLSPSQIFREVHDQKVLAGTPSPWPHRRRVGNDQSLAVSASNATLNQKGSPCAKCSEVLQDLLRRAQQLVEDTPVLPEDGVPEEKGDQLSPFTTDTLVDRMTSLYDNRRRQQQNVRRLMQRFQHLSTLLGADVGMQKSELLKYTREHQQLALQQHLQACERLVAERLWLRLQHREAAIETYAEPWNDKLAEAFLSEDQYEACAPWHQYHDDHAFFQLHVLPFALNGWISVTPADLENEQLWLSL